ncbi:MAG: nucleotide sugar dehydrogenase [Candidatus Omnitrophica bacterium]|nr:nucleotide sugar dehydrogenase [Candidatus Omnitrophota bacterium]
MMKGLDIVGRKQRGVGPLAQLAKRLKAKTARLGIIGLGYVGLPLAVEFAKEGFSVTGVDLDGARVDSVNRGRSYIPDVPSDDLTQLIRAKRVSATTQAHELALLDAIIICVPTPLRKTREPDISYILSAAQAIATSLRRGQLIVLESTTYPGTTDEVILPMLEAGGLRVGRDFCLAFSPERIDPGNTRFTTRTIPKVIGGVTPTCGSMAALLYGQIIQTVVPVSSTKVAEMVKLLENTFRAVNIGLVNEIALMCDKLGLDVWEVIEAAKTKPFGFTAFYPGPGIGGHCIPSDPMYLAWKARVHGFEARFIELADQTNRYMPHHVVDKIASALNARKKPLNGSKVLLIGLAYKKDVNDTRDSPAFEVAQMLHERGADVAYHDPYVPTAEVHGRPLRSIPLTGQQLKRVDCVVIITNHSTVDYDLIQRSAPLIVDTRNQYRRARSRSTSHVVKL